MLRSALLTFSLALLTGCGSGTAPTTPADSPPAAGVPAPPAAKQVDVTILGITPGKTTLDEFKKRFNVAEVKETAAQGVVTANAGPGAVIEGFKSLSGTFVDGVLAEYVAEAASSQSLQKILTEKLGEPSKSTEGQIDWRLGDRQILLNHSMEDAELVDSSTSLGLRAFDRGFRRK